MQITITPNPVLDKTISVKHIVFDEMSRATDVQQDWGGKGFNVSRALQAIGVENVAMGFIGGATGQKLRQGLVDLGIKTDLVSIAGETRTNIVIIEEDSERYIKVNEAGPTIQPLEIDLLIERVRQRVRPGDLCALCGSLPPGTPDGFFADLVTSIQSLGAKALLDTSGPPLKLGLEAQPFLVKPNTVEAAAFVHYPVRTLKEAKKAAYDFLKAGACMAALSMGPQGMILARREESRLQAIHAAPPQVQISNPTGAGDALLAGIIYALGQGWSMRDTARWGVASGTAAAMCKGVSVGTFEEIQKLATRVKFSNQWSDNE